MKKGTDLFFRQPPRAWLAGAGWKNRSVPFLLLLLAGCASSPPPSRTETRQAPAEVVTARNRGEHIASLAMQFRGTPYRFGGATPDGFDCSGLVFFTHRQFGVAVPRTSRDQARHAPEVKRRKLEPGDLVFFKIGSRAVNHVGIYVGDNRFVHAPRSGKPVTVNSLDEDYYDERFSSAGRYWDQPGP